MQQKSVTKLLGLNYEINYRPRYENKATNTLSRYPVQGEIAAMTTIIPLWQQELSDSYKEDLVAKELIVPLFIDP